MTDPSLEASLTQVLAKEAREHLATIRKGWRYVLDPIKVAAAGATQGGVRPATEDEVTDPPHARYDTPVMLAFWVHAAIDEWPTILQTLQPGTDGQLRLATTETIDCGDVLAMVTLLDREADRLVGWVDDTGRDFGASFASEMRQLARAVSRVAWPPKGDRMVLGDCPACGRRVRVKAPAYRRRPIPMPQPTTNPTEYADWTWVVPQDATYEPDRDKPIVCRCGKEGTLEEWRVWLTPFEDRQPMTANELVGEIRDRLGLAYQPLTVRTWQRRGLIQIVDYGPTGHARYDLTQVLASLIEREKRRDQAGLTSNYIHVILRVTHSGGQRLPRMREPLERRREASSHVTRWRHTTTRRAATPTPSRVGRPAGLTPSAWAVVLREAVTLPVPGGGGHTSLAGR